MKYIYILLFVFINASCTSSEDSNHSSHEKHHSITLNIPNNIPDNLIQTEIDASLTQEVNDIAENKVVKMAIDKYYGEWRDQVTINKNNMSKVKLSEKQYPFIYDMVKTSAQALNVKMPITYIVHSDDPNAYVLNVTEPILVLHSGLFHILNPEEILFVIGHELGHIKLQHMLSKEMVSTTFYAIDLIPTDFLKSTVASAAGLSFLQWIRESEASADRFGFLLVGDEKIGQNALIKIRSGLSGHYGEPDIDGMRKVVLDFNEENWLTQFPILLQQALSSHPFIPYRVVSLDEYANSANYQQLMAFDKNEYSVSIHESFFQKH